jgi:uncharacterized membrane protein
MSLPSQQLDRVAIAFSGVCAVHCVLVTLAAAAIPIWGLAWATAPAFHEWFLMLVIPLSLVGLWAGYRAHHRRFAATIGGLALSMLISAVILRENAIIGVVGESVITLSGAALLASAHLLNFRSSRGQRRHAHG